jgi:hypothetical protein
MSVGGSQSWLWWGVLLEDMYRFPRVADLLRIHFQALEYPKPMLPVRLPPHTDEKDLGKTLSIHGARREDLVFEIPDQVVMFADASKPVANTLRLPRIAFRPEYPGKVADNLLQPPLRLQPLV